ncbi:MAG: NUDIX hydrolase [Herbaspirillum sp.]
MDNDLIETPLESTLAYNGDFLKVQHDLIRLPDGKKATREYIKHPGAVVILPVFEDGQILLERQFRYPLRQVFIEFPAGKIDPGEGLLECAQRELREETGYTAAGWKYICTIHNAIGYSDEHLELYMARQLTPGIRELDEGEFLDTFKTTLPEAMSWVMQGKITDVKTIIGLFWLDKLDQQQWAI